MVFSLLGEFAFTISSMWANSPMTSHVHKLGQLMLTRAGYWPHEIS
jgi:hypothetical protein